jgi:purine-binding chemotaxis protein CheW
MKRRKSFKVEESYTAGGDKQYVTFFIMNEIYGVPVLKVQEIIGMTKITAMPDTPPFMKGVIDLRGVPVPVIDMRLKFDLEQAVYTNFTVIIIIEFRERLLGMIVDSVCDVLSVQIENIQETPSFAARINTSYLQGIGYKEEILIIILDSDGILTADEFDMIYKYSGIA